MMTYSGTEKRRHNRINKNFVVSYRIYGDPDNIDISQTKNISEGGILLTTNCAFDEGTVLAIEIRLPFVPNPIRLLGKVLGSREIARNLIYETRLVFTYMDDQSESMVKNTVDYFSKKTS
ncbi:PilZ domain-containing protein [Candidatus Omnitrophota bacterium]